MTEEVEAPVVEEATEETEEITGLERLAAIAERLEARDEAREADLERRINAVVEAAKGEPNTPSKTVEAGYHTNDEYDERGFSGTPEDRYGHNLTIEQRTVNRRSNFELARMLMGGASPRIGISPIEPSERFLQCYHAAVTEAPGQHLQVADDKGFPIRAMDTAESGYGSQLIGASYSSEMWKAAQNNDGIVSSIREISMTNPTEYIPIDGNPPEMLFVGESTTYNASAYDTVKTPSNRVSLAAKKFTIQQIWSGELNEDSIVAYLPFLREKLAESATLYLGSAYLNGDPTNAGTGNINLDDANPDDTKHYLAWNGIRYYWLVTTTGQGKNQSGELDPMEILRARGKLNGGDDDVDNLIKNANWGGNARDLRLVVDWDTYMNMLELDEVKTVDKYGPQATVVTGELGSFAGIPIISPPYASKTDTDGKAVDTETSNVKGQITLFNPKGWLGGVRRGSQIFMDRIQRTDQLLIEFYTRRAFTKYGEFVASGIYNITVA